jgi:hypothetical protein
MTVEISFKRVSGLSPVSAKMKMPHSRKFKMSFENFTFENFENIPWKKKIKYGSFCFLQIIFKFNS